MVARNHTRLTPEQQALAAANVALAFWAAKAYAAKFGLDREDCEGEALIGLTRAARGFREGRGARFSTYAHWCIRSRLSRLRSLETRRPDRYASSLLGHSRDSLPSEPTFWRSDFREPRADDPPCPSERREEVAAARSRAMAALRAAGKAGGDVLRERFLEGRTLKEIGDELGITREAVRQRQITAIGRVRKRTEKDRSGKNT